MGGPTRAWNTRQIVSPAGYGRSLWADFAHHL